MRQTRNAGAGKKRSCAAFGREVRPVYSKQFLATAVLTSGVADYTVPTGFVAVVKCFTAYKSLTTPAVSVYCGVVDPTNTFVTVFSILEMTSTTVLQTGLWNGMAVAPAGAKIRCGRIQATGSWMALVSGFLLTDV